MDPTSCSSPTTRATILLPGRPDGTKIAFNRAPPGENREIFVMDADGSNITNLTNSELDDVGPAWSPDGTRIAFEYLTDAWIMNADGSGRVDIGGNGDQSRLDWSPDSTQLAFTMYKCPTTACPGNNNEIWIMDADGANRVNITNHPSHDCCSDWSPITLQPLPPTSPFTYRVWQSTIRGGSLTLPGASEVLTSTVGGGISVGDESVVRETSASGGITINGDGTVVSSTVTGDGVHVSGAAWVADNRITTGECDWGVGVGSPAEVRGNRIQSPGLCAFAYGIHGTTDITITGNTVWGFDTGIKLDSGLVRGNLIHGNSQGLETSSATVISNTFTGTTDRALYVAGGIPPRIEGNNFEFNPGPYDMYNDNPSGSNVIAQHNWWGTTETMAIANRIYDFNDDWTKGQVSYTPVLTAPSADAPAYVRTIALTPESPVGIQAVAFDVGFSREMEVEQAPEMLFSTDRRGTWSVYNTSNSGLPDDTISSIALDKDGPMWLSGSQCNGVARFDGETWTTYEVSNSGLPSNCVFAIAVDNSGVKWFGTFGSGIGGIARFDGETWTVYNEDNSPLSYWDVDVIAIAPDGAKWFHVYDSATGIGEVARFDDANWTIYDSANSGLPDEPVTSIGFDVDGSIWFGTSGGGMVRFDGATWTTYDTSNSGLPDDYIMSLAVDHDGVKWFGTAGTDIVRFDGTTWSVYNYPTTGVPDIAVDRDGTKWFATVDLGVIHFDGLTWTIFDTSNSSLPENQVSEIAIDINGSKWFGTSNNGIGILWDGREYPIIANPEWVDPTRYRASYDINALTPARGLLYHGAGCEVGADGIEIVPNAAYSFTVDYAGSIADTTSPNPPSVTAWGDGSTTTLATRWSASDPESAITLYRYAVGTTPGGTDVVNWTTVGVTEVVRSGLNLLAGQTYYVSVKARNEGGLWSEPGISNGVVAGTATCDLAENDGLITLADVQAEAAHWRGWVGLPYDRDLDGRVTVADVMWYVANLGKPCP